MGYYTTFVLEDVKSYKLSKMQAFYTISEALKYTSGLNLYLEGQDTHKWYSWLEDCLEVSRQHPEIAFKISGIGENAEDIWWKDFLNGTIIDYWCKKEQPLKLSLKTLEILKKQYD